MSTLFSEVLSREAWLRTWDNILSNPPGFMLLVVVAYLTVARSTLLQCTQKEDFEVCSHIVCACDCYITSTCMCMYSVAESAFSLSCFPRGKRREKERREGLLPLLLVLPWRKGVREGKAFSLSCSPREKGKVKGEEGEKERGGEGEEEMRERGLGRSSGVEGGW